MMNSYRYIKKLFILGIGLMLTACAEEVMPGTDQNVAEGNGNVTLTLNVSVANSSAGTRTRDGESGEDDNNNKYSFDETTDIHELINTLRVIIVRQDNTVECNRLINLAPEVAVRTFGDLKFKVSTSLGKINEENLTRQENKRIYLIANEASIHAYPDGNDVQAFLAGLKPGYYKSAPDVDEKSEEFKKLTPEEQWAIKWKRDLYVAGDKFTPEKAASLIISNDWPAGSNGASPDCAVPYLNNENEKNFVPMTEFFDISVTEDLKLVNQKEQKEDLFITRNLVKFRFSIEATPGTTPFEVTSITFDRLMQEEFLFLRPAKEGEEAYRPPKDSDAPNDQREIISFATPGLQDKVTAPYVFRPQDFIWNGNKAVEYNPPLYFCETKTNILTQENKPKFTVGIDVKFPFEEEVKDADGNLVKDEDGNPVTQLVPVTSHFDAKLLNNLPYYIPRNTVVDVKMTLSNGELSAVATVFPYTAVNLNPEFGFTPPVSDMLTIAPTMDLVLNGDDGLIYPNFESESGNTIQSLYWVSSKPSVVLLSSEVTDVTDQRYVEPSESIELAYLQMVGDKEEPVPVRVVPKGVGTAIVTVYTQSGLVARCQVTVKE